MASVYQIKIGTTSYDISPAPSGTLQTGTGGYTSNDAASPTAWSSVDAITTSDTNSTIFGKITSMVKNTRYLYSVLGTGFSTTSTVTSQLSGKAPSSHTHTKSQITDFPSSLPASDVYSWAKASSKPTYTYSEVGAAASSHTHSYAGSSSAGGAANSVATSLTFNNGGSGAASGTTYNGSTARTISYNTIGAAASSHSHAASAITSGTFAIGRIPVSSSQTNSNSYVPTSALVYGMNTTLTSLNDAITNGGVLKKYTIVSPQSASINVSNVYGTFETLFTIPSFTIDDGFLFAVVKITCSNLSVTSSRVYYSGDGKYYDDSGSIGFVKGTSSSSSSTYYKSFTFNYTKLNSYEDPRTTFSLTSRSFYHVYGAIGNSVWTPTFYNNNNKDLQLFSTMHATVSSKTRTLKELAGQDGNTYRLCYITYPNLESSCSLYNNYKLSATGTITYEIYGYK